MIILDLVFERGTNKSPKGHALLFFTNQDDSSEIWATYLITLPIDVDITKYMPPFLMNNNNQINPSEFKSFAFPPSPEVIGSFNKVQSLAEQRDDDLIDGGSINVKDSANNMMKVNEILSTYLNLCNDQMTESSELLNEIEPTEESSVNSLMYEFMSVDDRMTELQKLISKLVYATENSEQELIGECENDIESLSKYYPDNHKINKIIEYTKNKKTSEIAELYYKRCFYLVKENYEKVQEYEKLIEEKEIN